MEIKASLRNGSWVTVESREMGETPEWRTSMEVWRKKGGMTLEWTEACGLRWGWGAGKGQATYGLASMRVSALLCVTEWNLFYMEHDLMVWNNTVPLPMLSTCSQLMLDPQDLQQVTSGPTISVQRVEWGHLIPAKLCLCCLPFLWGLHSSSHANSSRPWIFLTLSAIIYLSQASLSFQMSSRPLPSLCYGCVWCSRILAATISNQRMLPSSIGETTNIYRLAFALLRCSWDSVCTSQQTPSYPTLFPAWKWGIPMDSCACSPPTARLNIIST